MTYLLATYPVDRNVRTCTCRLHGSDCPCCIASLSNSIQAPQILLICDCDTQTPLVKGAVKLSELCRCKEGKRDYESPSIAVVIQSEVIVRLNEGCKLFCWKEDLILPGYKTPPMKPPAMV